MVLFQSQSNFFPAIKEEERICICGVLASKKQEQAAERTL